MDGGKTIGSVALRRIGQALQEQYVIQAKLPFRLSSLVAQLKRRAKEDDYLANAAETMRLAQHAPSSPEKTRLVKLAEGWVELASKAHEGTQRPRRPTILHPLVRKKLGDLPD